MREGAKFCDDCGAPIEPAVKSAEFKQVTVLFADVVHSMDIAAAVGAERLREIMNELVDRAVAVVQRYGGTVDKFTGDGIMALFGAPVALEDHAIRACLAALDIQAESLRLAGEVGRIDGIDLQLRVGLNSGEVIAGEVGSGSLGYTAVGEQVGMAERMESVAPPGAVMLSESTARLVERAAVLGEHQVVHIKGTNDPVSARCLFGMTARHEWIGRKESPMVGRRWEMAAVEAILDRSTEGHGGVVAVVGPAGIGKSRLVRETAAVAAARGVEAFWCFCESHAREIPFHFVARLLRTVFGVDDLDDTAARAQVRTRVPDADQQDLVLLDDLLGIGDPDIALPKIDPDARRRRLTALINAASLARTQPAVYIIEDAHWIDEISESMLAAFLTVTPQTPAMVLITYRPEYRGALAEVPGAQRIALAPLSDSETSALITALLGVDRSIGRLAATIATRAGGNPFFAQEIVRDLTERGVLAGVRGAYTCRADVAEISVPATLQATIAARIDRLKPEAKRTLSAAAVIGARFDTDLLTSLGIDPALDELVRVEMVDQVRFTPRAEYAFHHPLIRTVAYESQLKSDRAELHRRLAATIQADHLDAADENAALIGEHFEAAGDMRGAYGWHMRAGTWSATRDIAAAHLSWERARQIADALPIEDPDRTAMRIAPRTLLCGTGSRVHANVPARFEELQQLCAVAGDKASLAVGMTGLVVEHLWRSRTREASRLASEQMALLESIGDPTLTVGLPFAAILAKAETAEFADVLRWSQTVIDLADGDPAKGNLLLGSPLAAALASRGMARWCLGQPGWRGDVDAAVAMARTFDPLSHGYVANMKYGTAITFGVLRADDAALRDLDEALQVAERSADDSALGNVRLALSRALVYRDSLADRERGLELLGQIGDMCLQGRFFVCELPIVEVYAARERARRGDPDGALPLMRKAVDELFDAGQFTWFIPGSGVLAETLLERGTADDIAEAQTAIDRLAVTPTDDGLVVRDVLVLRLRALMARARGDQSAYRDFVGRYRTMARSFGFEGHTAWAEAMT